MKKHEAPAKEPFTNLDTITVLFIVGTLFLSVSAITRFATKYEARQQALDCKENIKLITRAVDGFYDRHKSTYPPNLKTLVPKFLDEMPRCPAAKETDRDIYVYQVDMHEVNYTIYCNGSRHDEAGLSKNEPRYSAARRWSNGSRDL